MGTQDSLFIDGLITRDFSYTANDKPTRVRWIGHTSTDYRRSHIEIYVNLKAGESIFSIPVHSEMQGTITKIRIRSRSEKIKFTLTEHDVYKSASDDPHPRDIIYQITTDSKDFTSDFDFIYHYNNILQHEDKIYAAIENQGADSDGVSVVITYGF